MEVALFSNRERKIDYESPCPGAMRDVGASSDLIRGVPALVPQEGPELQPSSLNPGPAVTDHRG